MWTKIPGQSTVNMVKWTKVQVIDHNELKIETLVLTSVHNRQLHIVCNRYALYMDTCLRAYVTCGTCQLRASYHISQLFTQRDRFCLR